jgi:hypothetical protein
MYANRLANIDPLSGLAHIDLRSNSTQQNILSLHGEMINAVYNKTSNLNVNCPGNNTLCRWADFASLGVCSSCIDVSQTSVERCWTTQCTANISALSSFPCNVASSLQNSSMPRVITTCEVTTPNNITINWSRISDQDPYCSTASPDQRALKCTVLTVLNSTTSWSGKPYPSDINKYIKQASPEILTYVGLRWNRPTTGIAWKEINQCSLTWCANKYVSPCHIDTVSSADQMLRLPLVDTTLDINKTSTFLNLTFFDNDIAKPLDPTEYPVVPTANMSGYYTFRINAPAAWTLGNILSGVFSQQLRVIESFRNVDLVIATMVYKHNSNWTDMMNRVATGLTVALRNAPESPLHYGKEFISDQYVHIHWIWLVPTAVLLTLTTVLLTLTIILTARYQIPVWKSLGLVYLFNGLVGWDRDELHAKSFRDMRRKAKTMVAQLRRNSDGDWQLAKS